MSFWERSILPRLVDFGMRGSTFREERPKCIRNAKGRVLEIGFGSGLNVPYYTEEVSELLALEPSELGRKLAGKRVAEAPFPVSFVGLDGAAIPLDDESVDCVTCTWTLCTIPDVEGALREVRRVLAPGGEFFFMEHGASRIEKVRRFQDRWNPLQKCLFGGCHVNREIDVLINAAGFESVEHEEYVLPGPRFIGSMYRGAARK